MVLLSIVSPEYWKAINNPAMGMWEIIASTDVSFLKKLLDTEDPYTRDLMDKRPRNYRFGASFMNEQDAKEICTLHNDAVKPYEIL